jgi:hypothetical protein
MLVEWRADSSPRGYMRRVGWSSTGSILASGEDILREKLALQDT